MKEDRSQHEEKVRKEGEKTMLDWLKLKKLWKKRNCSKRCAVKIKMRRPSALQWCKYTVMKRRTGQLLDLAAKKGALSQEYREKSRPKIYRRRRPKRCEGNLLKDLRTEYIASDREF